MAKLKGGVRTQLSYPLPGTITFLLQSLVKDFVFCLCHLSMMNYTGGHNSAMFSTSLSSEAFMGINIIDNMRRVWNKDRLGGKIMKLFIINYETTTNK